MPVYHLQLPLVLLAASATPLRSVQTALVLVRLPSLLNLLDLTTRLDLPVQLPPLGLPITTPSSAVVVLLPHAPRLAQSPLALLMR